MEIGSLSRKGGELHGLILAEMPSAKNQQIRFAGALISREQFIGGKRRKASMELHAGLSCIIDLRTRYGRIPAWA